MKSLVIIQARMGSSRLPGKVLKELAGVPVLCRVAERVAKSDVLKETVVATSTSGKDDPVADCCAEAGIQCFRGDEEDVLDRFMACAEKFDADVIARITSDCPLIEPDLLDFVADEFLERSEEIDYICNVIPPTFPDGLDVEVFSMDALKRAWNDATDPLEREHVTLHFWKNPDMFRLMNVRSHVDLSAFRWTLDTREDLDRIREVYEALYEKGGRVFGMDDILGWLVAREDSGISMTGGDRRQNSLAMDELNALIEREKIPSVIYQPGKKRGARL